LVFKAAVLVGQQQLMLGLCPLGLAAVQAATGSSERVIQWLAITCMMQCMM
jgi:hypothetical protein